MQQPQHFPAMAMALGLVVLLPMCLAPLAGSVAPAPPDARGNTGDRELTRTQATALVQSRYAARVVRVANSDEGGRHLYVFRLLSEGGKVWQVRIDARTGLEVP
jgi:hypothetical protein